MRYTGIFLEEDRQLLIDDRFDNTFNLTVAEFGLRLPLKLGLRHLDTNNPGQPFTDIVARRILFNILEQAVSIGIGIDRTGQGTLQADQMRATLNSIDGVHERQQHLVITVVVLQGDLKTYALTLTTNVDRLWVEYGLVLIQIGDKRLNTTLVVKGMGTAITFVLNDDTQAAV